MTGSPALEGGALASEVARRILQRDGEAAVLGLGRSGVSAARLLHNAGMRVYASDVAQNESVQQAANMLSSLGVAVDVGQHDLARIKQAGIVVVSPGIPPTAPPVLAARSANVPVVSEVEIAIRFSTGIRFIAVTGTNGKTTTTALIGHLLRAIGQDAVDVGNIGTPVTEVVTRNPRPAWAALEMSSFQLHDTPGLMPHVGVLTTLSPDHLDRYASVEEYYADKARMFDNATPLSRWVVTADNADVQAMVRNVAGRVYRFSTERSDVDAWYDRDDDALVVLGERIVSREDLQLAGHHNVANALAALLAVIVADPAHQTPEARRALAQGIASFRALAHRLDPVAEANGVLWINDSKATNVSSTLVAVKGMTRPTVLLLGGRHKGEPYTVLAEPLRRIARAVIAYGEAADEIERDLAPLLGSEVPLHVLRDASFREVMTTAKSLTQSGDVVLLSPACSSYDMFNNYEERGRTFAALAREFE